MFVVHRCTRGFKSLIKLVVLISSWLFFLPSYALELAPLPDFSKNPQNKIHLFTIAGSNTIGAALGPVLVQRYFTEKGLNDIQVKVLRENEKEISGLDKKQNKMLTVVVKAHGSSSGFKAIAADEAAVAAASRPIKDKEWQRLKSKGDFRSGEAEHIVAIDGLAIIVNQENPIKQLAVEQIKKLFTGGIASWSGVGGPPLTVTRFARDKASGTWDTFSGLVLKKHSLASGTVRLESNTDLSHKVTQNPGAVGFVSLNTIGKAKPLSISVGGGNHLAPSLLNVATEDYSLGRRLYFYLNPNQTSALAQEFVQFALSQKGQSIVSEEGFVGQNIISLDQDLAGKYPENYIDQVKGFKRLSVNFRFDAGKSKLDNKGKRDLMRLKAFYDQQRKSGAVKIILRGFAQQYSSVKKTTLLSNLRAKAVTRALIKVGIDRTALVSMGYGALDLAKSSNDPASKEKNHRVEVWMKK